MCSYGVVGALKMINVFPDYIAKETAQGPQATFSL
jgi:hypothetical protein